ncbi:MAG: hypothetical protein NC184_01300 [Roseburia sp.]|nr:hypothetical protein [Roseburia sp.]
MDKLKGILCKLKKVGHIELVAVGALLAVALIVYFSCLSCSEEKNEVSVSAYSDTDYCTAMQTRIEKIVSEISGVGDASVVVNWDRSTSSFSASATENPKAVGALIVCDGGNSTKVKLDVTYAVSTLLDLSIDRIIVYPKSN